MRQLTTDQMLFLVDVTRPQNVTIDEAVFITSGD